MNMRMPSWLALSFVLLLAGCPGGGGGDGGFGTVPFVLEAYLKASNTEATDNFGQKVAIDGDTLVIGAPNENSNATGVGGNQADNSAANAGAVYVFVRVGGIWSQQAYIKASNTGAGDAFGTSVAISGNTLVVGAPGEDGDLLTGSTSGTPNNATTGDGALASGAVYVFVRNAGVWTQQAYIKSFNAEAGDTFGTSVAISGNTLVAGAPDEASNAMGIGGNQTDNSATGAGAVYIFTRSGITWSQQAYVKAFNTGANDGFGTSVGIDSDTLVVGAIGEDSNATGIGGNQTDNSATGAGAVYVFTRSGTTWSQQAYIKASNTGAGDAFGSSVAINGDTLAVGAPDEDSNATDIGGDETDNSAVDAGAVYVFTRTAGAWTPQVYVKASNTGAGDEFGRSVALNGTRLVVGAPSEDGNRTTVLQGSPNSLATGNGAADAGAVYAFANSGGVWSQQAYVKASNAEPGDAFGTSVAISGNTLVVSATGEDSNATGIGGDQTNDSALESGAAYVFR